MNIAGIEEAIQSAEDKGYDVGLAKGYAQGRAEVATIVKDPAAVGRRELAAELAGDAQISVDKAIDLLSISERKSTFTDYRSLLNAANEPVTQSGPHHEVAKKVVRVEELTKLGRSVSRD